MILMERENCDFCIWNILSASWREYQRKIFFEQTDQQDFQQRVIHIELYDMFTSLLSEYKFNIICSSKSAL